MSVIPLVAARLDGVIRMAKWGIASGLRALAAGIGAVVSGARASKRALDQTLEKADSLWHASMRVNFQRERAAWVAFVYWGNEDVQRAYNNWLRADDGERHESFRRHLFQQNFKGHDRVLRLAKSANAFTAGDWVAQRDTAVFDERVRRAVKALLRRSDSDKPYVQAAITALMNSHRDVGRATMGLIQAETSVGSSDPDRWASRFNDRFLYAVDVLEAVLEAHKTDNFRASPLIHTSLLESEAPSVAQLRHSISDAGILESIGLEPEVAAEIVAAGRRPSESVALGLEIADSTVSQEEQLATPSQETSELGDSTSVAELVESAPEETASPTGQLAESTELDEAQSRVEASAEELVDTQPAGEANTADELAVEESTTDAPALAEPATDESVSEDLATEEPATDAPATDEPALGEPATVDQGDAAEVDTELSVDVASSVLEPASPEEVSPEVGVERLDENDSTDVSEPAQDQAIADTTDPAMPASDSLLAEQSEVDAEPELEPETVTPANKAEISPNQQADGGSGGSGGDVSGVQDEGLAPKDAAARGQQIDALLGGDDAKVSTKEEASEALGRAAKQAKDSSRTLEVVQSAERRLATPEVATAGSSRAPVSSVQPARTPVQTSNAEASAANAPEWETPGAADTSQSLAAPSGEASASIKPQGRGAQIDQLLEEVTPETEDSAEARLQKLMTAAKRRPQRPAPSEMRPESTKSVADQQREPTPETADAGLVSGSQVPGVSAAANVSPEPAIDKSPAGMANEPEAQTAANAHTGADETANTQQNALTGAQEDVSTEIASAEGATVAAEQTESLLDPSTPKATGSATPGELHTSALPGSPESPEQTQASSQDEPVAVGTAAKSEVEDRQDAKPFGPTDASALATESLANVVPNGVSPEGREHGERWLRQPQRREVAEQALRRHLVNRNVVNADADANHPVIGTAHSMLGAALIPETQRLLANLDVEPDPKKRGRSKTRVLPKVTDELLKGIEAMAVLAQAVGSEKHVAEARAMHTSIQQLRKMAKSKNKSDREQAEAIAESLIVAAKAFVESGKAETPRQQPRSQPEAVTRGSATAAHKRPTRAKVPVGAR